MSKKKTTKPKKTKSNSGQKYVVHASEIRSITQSITARLKKTPSGKIGRPKKKQKRKATTKRDTSSDRFIKQMEQTAKNVEL